MQTPSDCAFLITVPLTDRDFLSDLHNPDKDFVKNWADNQRLASDEDLTDAALWTIYSARVRDFVLKAADEIQSLGVEVNFNTKRQDLSDVFLKKKVVTLEAHWFSPKLGVEDFYNPDNFVKTLSESNRIVAKALRQILFAGESSSFGKFKELAFVDLVANINRIFSGYNLRSRRPEPILVTSGDGETSEEIWIHLNRFALEKAFPNEVKSQCRIEMFDGLCPLENFVHQVPLDFDGVIDLTVCNSELVGKTLKEYRRNCLVVTNRFVTDLKLRMILHKGAMNLLLNGICETYIDAVISLRKQLSETKRREE